MPTWFTTAPSHEWLMEIPTSADFTVDLLTGRTRTLSDSSTRTLSDGTDRTIGDFTGTAHPGLWFTEAPDHTWSEE